MTLTRGLLMLFLLLAGLIYGQKGSVSSLLDRADSLKFRIPSEAQRCAEKGLVLAIGASDRRNTARAYSLMGVIKDFQGNYQEALQDHLESLSINEALRDTAAICGNYNNLGMVLDNIGRAEESIRYYRKGISLQKRIGGELLLIKLYNNLGAVYMKRNLTEGLKYFEEAALLAHNRGLWEIEGSIRHNIGMMHLGYGRYDQAWELFSASLNANRAAGNDKGMATNLLYLGKTEAALKKDRDALAHLMEAYKLSRSKGFKDILAETCLQIAVYYEAQNLPSKSLLFMKERSELQEQIYSEASAREMAEMRTRYETDRKEKENALLVRKNRIKTLEVSRKEQQRNMLLGACLILLLAGGLVYNYLRLRNRNRILMERHSRSIAIFKAQEDEKIRISRELHDGVGPLLSLIKLNVSSLDVTESNERLLESTKKLTSESIREIRDISHSLMPGILMRSGLKAALEELIEQVAIGGQLTGEILYNVSTTLRPEAEVAIYRIAQEVVNNAIRHADATKITIQLEELGRELLLKIADNGRGFDTGKSELAGNGLNNIHSRIDFMRGRLQLFSASDTGTIYTVHFPIQQLLHG